ncbi:MULTISPECIES: fimbria/pilus chaperone family protein [unclassified Pseudomonas]|uniref:fimbria/pilus chaperone family protein n=1 Tax=unclassified Pseudomonas TaxID=196821 RepID=UPI0015A3E23C|nr:MULTISPECIES: fimbria/pilus chaperone family protein [unclassified Pseudomonas]NWC94507.1 fimbria/pilus periplasmic chaperone [Pseudomonas sp. IPO3779]NWD15262.1 fimbria/pilus periplasmic chaperone [Pseudomonas sp. IPO3778]
MTPLRSKPAVRHSLSLGLLSLVLSCSALADGMVPETSVVIVHEAEGEAAVSVTNTDAQVALLHVTLENVPEDTESLLVVTPPLARVNPSASQLVRFILQNPQPLTTQRLKRAIFEGMPQDRAPAEAGHARVGVTVRQNLPVIIHPKGLAPNRTPWTGLSWSLNNNALSVLNDTPYVVRLAQELQLLPGKQQAMLPRTYILPGEHLTVGVPAQSATSVRLQPATVYGFAVAAYDAPITSTLKRSDAP